MKDHKYVAINTIDHLGEHQRGVYAQRKIKKGSLIEVAPALVIPKNDVESVNTTHLQNYVFEWGDDGEDLALALGYGSLYNHSYEPNAYYEQDYENQTFEIRAYRDIAKGEEITINYNGDPADDSALWFDVYSY